MIITTERMTNAKFLEITRSCTAQERKQISSFPVYTPTSQDRMNPRRQNYYQRISEILDDNHSVDMLDTKSSFNDIPPVLAYSDDGSDVEERPKRMFRDRRDLEAHRRRQQRSRSRSKRSDNRGYKCALCVTLVVLAFCVVGLAVLGTLYGVEYVNKLSSVEQKDELVNVFNLQQTPRDAVFIKCTYRPPYIEALDGAYYFLLDEDGIMPWQSPDGRATLTWLKGESVKTYTIDRVGRLSTHVLGDPAVVPGAQYTLSMDSTDWFTARGLGKYSFVALNTIGTFGKFVDANVTSLLMKVGSDDQNLLQELRQFTRA